MYEKLSKDNLLRFVTVSEALEMSPPKTKIDHLFPGSWINHNFRIWIGHGEDNKAWDLLSEARQELCVYQSEYKDADKKTLDNIQNAWKEIYIDE